MAFRSAPMILVHLTKQTPSLPRRMGTRLIILIPCSKGYKIINHDPTTYVCWELMTFFTDEEKKKKSGKDALSRARERTGKMTPSLSSLHLVSRIRLPGSPPCRKCVLMYARCMYCVRVSMHQPQLLWHCKGGGMGMNLVALEPSNALVFHLAATRTRTYSNNWSFLFYISALRNKMNKKK